MLGLSAVGVPGVEAITAVGPHFHSQVSNLSVAPEVAERFTPASGQGPGRDRREIVLGATGCKRPVYGESLLPGPAWCRRAGSLRLRTTLLADALAPAPLGAAPEMCAYLVRDVAAALLFSVTGRLSAATGVATNWGDGTAEAFLTG